MGMTLIQAGSSLQMTDTSGTLTTLTLPTGITLRTDLEPRFAQYGRYIVMVNSPNRPITIDPLGVVRVLTPFAPSQVVTLSSGGAGALTGSYKAKQTFVIRDTYGNVIAESDFGPEMSTGFSASGNTLAVGNINISGDDVTGTRIYRTTAGGAVYFRWRDLDGNVATSSDNDDLADLALDEFAAPTLGTPPDLMDIIEWRGRLWGKSRTNIDDVYYSEAGAMYAWPDDNTLSIPKVGSDNRGVTAFIKRRESLIVGRQNSIQQITGTDDSDFRVVGVTDQCGIESAASVALYKEAAFFLGKDGVYKLDSDGITCVSNGKSDGSCAVRKWFTTDTYFNRAQFQYARAVIDPVRLKYRLLLSAAGSTNLDRWVEYDLEDGTWWGPHKTDDFTPVSMFVVVDANDQLLPMIGSSTGFLYKEQTTATDGTATGIDMSVDIAIADEDAEYEKYFGRLTMLGKVQTQGNVKVTPTVGYGSLATIGLPQYYQMAKGTQTLGRLGLGETLALNFRHTTAAEPVELYGFEIDDIHLTGRRNIS